MKRFVLIFSILFAVTLNCFGQDRHPESSIFMFDYQTNQEVAATSDAAILFKNALIDLVTNTRTARMQIRIAPGRKSFVITQADPSGGTAFQIVYQTVFLRQATPLYTFMYNVDQNTLSYFNPTIRAYVQEIVVGDNVANLMNCQQLGHFNDPQQVQTAPPVPAAVNAQVQPVVNDEAADGQFDEAVRIPTAPPELPEYEQPECPVEGYLWQPGYWAYSPQVGQYYWVPGAWVAPPQPGVLWTPPYWGYEGNVYVFHAGYWGPTIGFYGGINYGYGYWGVGFVGGEWYAGHFRYNTAVTRVSVTVHNVYINRTVIYRGERSRVAFNGGHGGIMARPTPAELRASNEHHIMATEEQRRNMAIARDDKKAGKPTSYALSKVPERRPAPMNSVQGTNKTGFGAKPGVANNGIHPGAPGTPNTSVPNRTINMPGNPNTTMPNHVANTATSPNNVPGRPNAVAGTPSVPGSVNRTAGISSVPGSTVRSAPPSAPGSAGRAVGSQGTAPRANENKTNNKKESNDKKH